MSETSLSLLARAGGGDGGAWERLDALYRPLVRGWLIRHHLDPHDADDLTQDVLLAVVRALGRFRHPGRPGAFRGWLRVITANRAKEFWRAGRCRVAVDGDAFLRAVEGLEDAASSVSAAWDREHDVVVLRRLLDLVAEAFEPRTVRAFHLLVFDGRSGAEVAVELGMTVAGVYAAKARVLSRLRAEAGDLID
jgi:RNA polymerase sigma-70 factor (ECF subfamily)